MIDLTVSDSAPAKPEGTGRDVAAGPPLSTVVLGSVGAIVSGVEVDSVDADCARRLEHLLALVGVIILRDQVAGDRQFRAFLSAFGTAELDRVHPRAEGWRADGWALTAQRTLGVPQPRAGAVLFSDRRSGTADVLRHSWAAGDVLIWDNAVVLHRQEVGADPGLVLGRGRVVRSAG